MSRITNARYMNEENTRVRVKLENGDNAMFNLEHRVESNARLQRWIDAGNTVSPYVAPPPEEVPTDPVAELEARLTTRIDNLRTRIRALEQADPTRRFRFHRGQ